MAQQPEEENLLADEGAPGAAPEEGVELQTVKLEEMAPVVRGPEPLCLAEAMIWSDVDQSAWRLCGRPRAVSAARASSIA